MKRLFLSLLCSGVLLTFYSCDTKQTANESETDTTTMTQENDMNTTQTSEEEQSAQATISSASGSEVSGTATFTQENGSVKLELDVENLEAGTHAVHLHENGDCSAADAASAGGHWNPTEMDHGKRGDMPFHKGDIDNLEVGEDGQGTMEMTIEGWTVGGPDSTNIVGTAIIIHAVADDFTSQPSGDAGARIACGVVQMN